MPRVYEKRRALFCAALLLFLCAALFGCGTHNYEGTPASSGRRGGEVPVTQRPGEGGTAAPKGTFRAYTQDGRTYQPLFSSAGYSEEGLASWYGLQFHGKKTANGEYYDMYDETAAHRILPMGTMLKVENLDNGRSTTVRVNDRGPFVDPDHRIIDLSFAAARDLGMDRAGLAHVRISSIGAIAGFTGTDLKGSFYVQVGAFTVKANADRLAASMVGRGYKDTKVEQADVDGRTFWRVQAGVFPSLNAAEQGKEALRGEFPQAFVIAADR
ncbi:rare lipoprotein A [Desulfovibrio sp. X2]|uniref:septal ring lytic transglycosylase RlpA family protein n=1 Tax=Desulfovibrio sp. X2 TaxID=941449 RepID=UPI0003586FE1|nr:septal ring lytic transglycosylase RlpA family protein [Desulfovibrio sp. X2]EPR43991.1 rare lipoprotein A [Desulfovibrio sp. X2]